MELTNTEKVNSIISLSNHVYDETKRYREHVWKMLIWTIGLIVGVITAANSQPDLFKPNIIKWLASIFVVVVAFCGIYNIHFDYNQFVWNRNILRECERRLLFYDKGIYGDTTILPEEWKTNEYKFKHCLQHYIQWIFAIVVIAIYCFWALWS
jgi:hypothetical protein